MSHLYFKKIGLIAGGIAVSIALAVIMEGLTSMNSPGFIIQGYLLPGHGAVHPLSRCTPFSKGALGSPPRWTRPGRSINRSSNPVSYS